MTAITDPPKGEFRIGMLLSDTRYRSVTIQIIAMVVFMLAVGWLVNNVINNLADLGKDFSFRFMVDPASYDINQRLIDYTSRSTHATAAVVGILNTLLVAVMGCILATIIGVIAGVLRLSHNWIVSKLMTVYIEGVRNVPVLIQILLLAAVFDEFLPSPKQAEMLNVLWVIPTEIIPTNRGFYIPGPVFHAGSAWVVLAFVLGVCASIGYARHAQRVQQDTGEILPTFKIGLALWVLPPVVVFILFWIISGAPISVEYPELKGFNYAGGIYARNSLVAIWLALSIYTGAFIAENVRAGIMAVDKGQTEAAAALGLRANRIMRLVILPQALRVIIPPLISQYLNLTKNSSLAIAVGYMDATGTLGGITLNQTGKEMETLLLLMGFYLTISLTISMIMNLYNEQVKLVERTSATGVGLTFAKLLDKSTGPWETLKKGDAAHQSNYGVAGWLNLVILLYAVILVALLNYLFLLETPEARVPYYQWSFIHQVAVLLLLASTLATLLTGVFKHYRFIDFAAVTAILWVLAVLVGFPIGDILPFPSIAVIVVGLALQIASIFYIMVGDRPNVTYLNRVKEAAS